MQWDVRCGIRSLAGALLLSAFPLATFPVQAQVASLESVIYGIPMTCRLSSDEELVEDGRRGWV